ncbi:MAG: hypothetical protein KGO82_18680 [Bacteroidota bacterium]|nr:hypothetical protein [Bacteroidota bacterium]
MTALQLLVTVIVLNVAVAAGSFIAYGRARMQEREADEKRWLKFHYTSLFILLAIGVLYMFFMVQTAD